MYKWKRFIQGPNLYDEAINYADNKGTAAKAIRKELTEEEGLKAFEAYQEIVNQPSASSSQSTGHEETTGKRPSRSRKNSKKKQSSSSNVLQKEKEKIYKSPPTLSQLMRLCESNDYQGLEEILNTEDYTQEIDLDLVDEFNWTILMCSACAGAVDCVELLLRRGSDWNLRDKKGLSAYSIAKKKNRPGVCQAIEEWCQFVAMKNSESLDGEYTSTATGTVEIIDDEKSDTPDFCLDCQVNYTNKSRHKKSIAHLVSSTKYQKEKIHYGIPESNKGFQMMLNSNWDRDTALGPEGTGLKFPVKTILKRDRKGFGNNSDVARVTHFGPGDPNAVAGYYSKKFSKMSKEEKQIQMRKRTIEKLQKQHEKNREKRKEIQFRRDLSSI